MVVLKPGGILVHRSELSGERDVLLQRVRDQLGQPLFPVHRLDRPTSGALVFALSPEDARATHDALRAPEAHKQYLALVRGVTPERFVSERPIGGKEARTEFERVAQVAECSLLEVTPRTGRRHQIRKHLDHLAHHVLGDTSHGKGRINRFFRETYGLPRLFLHAHRLGFAHPREARRVEVLAPLAADLRAFLARLPGCDAEPLRARWGYDPLAR